MMRPSPIVILEELLKVSFITVKAYLSHLVCKPKYLLYYFDVLYNNLYRIYYLSQELKIKVIYFYK